MHSILRGSVYNSVALRWNWFWANCSINKTPSINWLIKERLREVEVLFWLQRCTAVTHTFLHEVLFDWYICVHWGGGSSEGELRAETFCQSWNKYLLMVLNVTRMEELWTSIYVDLSLMCSDGNIYLHQQKWSLWTGKVFINFPILS